MPVVCPLSFGRRAQQAFVSHHVLQRTLTRTARANKHRYRDKLLPPSPSLLTALDAAAQIRKAPALHLRSDDVSFVATHGDPTARADNELASRQDDAGYASSETRLLRSLLARRVHALAQAEDQATASFTTTRVETDALHSAGFSLHHLDRWVDILTEHSSMRAATLLTAHPTAPHFVFEYLLRRKHIATDALRLLVHHLPTWHASAFHSSTPATSLAGNNDAATHIFRVFVRILRHCRRVWPDALETLATFVVRHLSLSLKGHPTNTVPRLTHLYNRALSLLAEPSRTHPFGSALSQEHAQSVILRHMLSHDPPLVINREGYRGVIRVQLASQKTPSDREWARLKSPSWPPWREDHTGMDAHIRLEYAISRAHQVLNRMQEAGYPLRQWDQTAMIYAGWDTDSSPTIQTRVLLPPFPDPQTTIQTWIARIRTTRTAQQAWACFLAYQDERLRPHQSIYMAMFEVLIQERKRLRLGPESIGHERIDDDSPRLYPGDTKEIGSPPSSAHQLTYTRTDVPTVQQLFQHMCEENLRPTKKTLELLAKNSESLEEGLTYFKSSADQQDMAVESLFQDTINQENLSKLADPVFAAYIDLLCRFPGSPLEPISPAKYNYGNVDLPLRQPLSRAIYLLVKQHRQHLPAWISLFRTLARRQAPFLGTSWRDYHLMGHDLNFEREMYDKLFAITLARRFTATMLDHDLTPDSRIFRSICITAESAALASRRILERFGADSQLAADSEEPRLVTRAAKTIGKTPVFLRRQFRILVQGRGNGATPTSHSTDGEIELPRLLITPHPAVLHVYIRALGLLHDHEGLEELVRWMVEFKDEVSVIHRSSRNGERMMRRALTALRLFMSGGESFSKRAKVSQIEELRELVDSVDEWGGWATDEEVEIYLARKEQKQMGL